MTEYYNENKQKTKIKKKIKGNNYHMKTSTSFYTIHSRFLLAVGYRI